MSANEDVVALTAWLKKHNVDDELISTLLAFGITSLSQLRQQEINESDSAISKFIASVDWNKRPMPSYEKLYGNKPYSIAQLNLCKVKNKAGYEMKKNKIEVIRRLDFYI